MQPVLRYPSCGSGAYHQPLLSSAHVGLRQSPGYGASHGGKESPNGAGNENASFITESQVPGHSAREQAFHPADPQPSLPGHPLRSFSIQPTPAGKETGTPHCQATGTVVGGATGTHPGSNLKQETQLSSHQGSDLLGPAGRPLRRGLSRPRGAYKHEEGLLADGQWIPTWTDTLRVPGSALES